MKICWIFLVFIFCLLFLMLRMVCFFIWLAEMDRWIWLWLGVNLKELDNRLNSILLSILVLNYSWSFFCGVDSWRLIFCLWVVLVKDWIMFCIKLVILVFVVCSFIWLFLILWKFINWLISCRSWRVFWWI